VLYFAATVTSGSSKTRTSGARSVFLPAARAITGINDYEGSRPFIENGARYSLDRATTAIAVRDSDHIHIGPKQFSNVA